MQIAGIGLVSNVLFLVAFTELHIVTISFIMSVQPCIGLHGRILFPLDEFS